jgi:hypothetical protein
LEWTAPATVTAVAAADGLVAAGLATGEVDIVVARAVRQRYEIGGHVDAVALSGNGVVVQSGRELSRRMSSTGPQPEYTLTLPKGAQLDDADATRAVYIAAGKAHLVTFASTQPPRDAVVGSAQHAQLDGNRLVLANGRSLVVKPL